MTGTLLTAFLALMVTGIPVAIAMAGASLIYFYVSGSSPPMVVVHRMISGIDSFPLLAVPFFILAGNLMNNAGITNRIYNFALALVGWMKGGLGHVNIIYSVCAIGFAAAAVRSVQVAIENWRRGWSLLEQPEHAIEETIE